MSARPRWWVGLTAGWVALTVLRRMWRGEVVVLSQYGAPVVRLLAIVLVFVASCVEKVRSLGADPVLAQEPGVKPVVIEAVVAVEQGFPAGLDDARLQRVYNWIAPRELHRYFVRDAAGKVLVSLAEMDGWPRSSVLVADEAMNRRADAFQAAVAGHLSASGRGAPAGPELLALLDAAEAVGVYDEWLAGYLWRYARTLQPAPVTLFARIDRHLRVVHALALGQASTGPLEFSAWRSKAGPPPGWQRLRVPAGLVAAARDAFEKGADAGTWESEAVLELTVARGEVVLVRRASETRLVAGASLRLRRLDVVRAAEGAVLRHATLGELRLQAGAEMTAWNVPQCLEAAGQAWVEGRTRAALDGEAAALTELEAVLPAAHAAMRAALERSAAEGPGRAALRMVLQAYDE